jgi:hypothetical protein
MVSRHFPIVPLALLLIGSSVSVAGAASSLPATPSSLERDRGALLSVGTDISASRHYRHDRRYAYGYRRSTLPYEGYRPYAPPLCPDQVYRPAWVTYYYGPRCGDWWRWW